MPSTEAYTILGWYESERLAKLALRQWRGLYGDPETDPEDFFFRVRYLGPSKRYPEYSWAIVSFTDQDEADAVNEQGEISDAIHIDG